MIIVVVTMVIAGLLSIKLKNPIFFKFQPVVTGVIFAGVLAYFQWFDTPFIVKVVSKISEASSVELIPPQMQAMLKDDSFIPTLARLNRNMIIMLLLHAAIVAFAALKTRNSIWLLAKALGLPFIALGCFVIEWLT